MLVGLYISAYQGFRCTYEGESDDGFETGGRHGEHEVGDGRATRVEVCNGIWPIPVVAAAVGSRKSVWIQRRRKKRRVGVVFVSIYDLQMSFL